MGSRIHRLNIPVCFYLCFVFSCLGCRCLLITIEHSIERHKQELEICKETSVNKTKCIEIIDKLEKHLKHVKELEEGA